MLSLSNFKSLSNASLFWLWHGVRQKYGNSSLASMRTSFVAMSFIFIFSLSNIDEKWKFENDIVDMNRGKHHHVIIMHQEVNGKK